MAKKNYRATQESKGNKRKGFLRGAAAFTGGLIVTGIAVQGLIGKNASTSQNPIPDLVDQLYSYEIKIQDSFDGPIETGDILEASITQQGLKEKTFSAPCVVQDREDAEGVSCKIKTGLSPSYYLADNGRHTLDNPKHSIETTLYSADPTLIIPDFSKNDNEMRQKMCLSKAIDMTFEAGGVLGGKDDLAPRISGGPDCNAIKATYGIKRLEL